MGAPTRWTYEYTSVARMLRLEGVLISCVATSKNDLLVAGGNDDTAVSRAMDIIEVCLNQEFWKNLRRICTHIEPLAIAANIFQAPTCRLDHVLLTLGNLFHFYQSLPTEDSQVTSTMHGSLERRWKNNADQELFILGVFFNPFIRARYFNHSTLSKMAVFHITRRAYERFFRCSTQDDATFFSSFDRYYDREDDFSDEALNLPMFVAQHRHAITVQKRLAQDSIDVLRIWRWLEEGSSAAGRGGLVQLAIRILSMVPNSASTERTFSIYGCIHTKRRNRLAPTKVHDAYLVQCDRNTYHSEHSDVTKPGRKRHFGTEGVATSESSAAIESRSTLEEEGETDVDHESALLSLIDHAREIDSYDETSVTPDLLNNHNELLASSSFSEPIPPYRKITLKDLFNYSMQEQNDDGGLRFHWSMGKARVAAEEEELEITRH